MKNLRNTFLVLIVSLFSINSFAQSGLSGEFLGGDKNTVVKIVQQNGIYSGKIVSSDNPKAEIGKLMVKDIEQIKGKWKGKIYAPKQNEWVDAEFTLKGNKLFIKMSKGYFSKTIEWIKK